MSSMFTRLRRCSVRERGYEGLGTRAEAPGCMIKGFGFKISAFRNGGYRAWFPERHNEPKGLWYPKSCSRRFELTALK